MEIEQAAAGAVGRWDGGGRGLLRASGGDRVRFLNGMLSADVAELGPERVLYAMQLDRRGHIVADLFAIEDGDGLLLDIAPGRAAAVRELLEKHIIADDVALEDRSAEWAGVAFEGAGARATLEAQGHALPAPERAARGEGELRWIGAGLLTGEGVRAVGPRAEVAALADASRLPPLDPDAVELLRIQRFVPAFGIDMGERSFPAEARLERALSYTKGCYIGQEIVARIHSRGAVKRLLVQLRSEAPVAAGDPIRADGRNAGAVTSAARRLPPSGATALGQVRREWAAPGTELRVGEGEGVPASVLGPPLEG